MLIKLLTKIFGNYSDRILRRMQKIVDNINRLEPLYNKMSDNELQNQTKIFRLSLSKGTSLDALLPYAFATVREASKRIFGMRHFDVQLLGGIVLHKQYIAEMKTGEGKTLTSTLPAYLNALSQHGVHIVTMNEYLADRDFKKNSILFSFLGLTVGLNKIGLSTQLKQQAYAADITYGTNNEYGFDYLRDNMIFHSSERVQRKLHYALLDEVDSILIDEARTPLIISGLSEDNSILYIKINKIIPYFVCQTQKNSDLLYVKGDFIIDEKQKQIYFTDRGLIKLESLLVDINVINKEDSLYSEKNIFLIQHVNAALRAHNLFTCNVDYIVQNKEIIIIDEHTGRPMLGRRWSDGLHQAIEAKENVDIKHDNHTLASITFQNYFRLYQKLSGMTGTAVTESFEFSAIYNLDTIIIPTHCPMIRQDLPDLVFMSEEEKIDAIINDIQNCAKKKQPVLVGTISIEKSELISSKLRKLKIKHNVLNAKHHSQEAKIIAEAGQLNAITISTNMAGRGTDIVLGGNFNIGSHITNNLKNNSMNLYASEWKKRYDEVLSVGGLHIIGTERHESRRIDNQLRGRSGRQGDSGSSRFYLSMEDSLMRLFASSSTISMMKALGIKSGEAITHPFVNKVIANAQKKIENYNFNIRKQVLEYDNVINEQRKVMYEQRNQLIDIIDISIIIDTIIQDLVYKLINIYIKKNIKRKNILMLEHNIKEQFGLTLSIIDILNIKPCLNKKEIINIILKKVKYDYFIKKQIINSENMKMIEKSVMLHTLDIFWNEHLSAMEYLRHSIHLQCYAQKDPKQEYKRESFKLFSSMLEAIKSEVIFVLYNIDYVKFTKKNDLNDSILSCYDWYNLIYNQL